MVRRPAIFNEALGSFYRSTAEVARRRAAAGMVLTPALGGSGFGANPRLDAVLVDGSLERLAGAPGSDTNGEWLAHANDGPQEAGQ